MFSGLSIFTNLYIFKLKLILFLAQEFEQAQGSRPRGPAGPRAGALLLPGPLPPVGGGGGALPLPPPGARLPLPQPGLHTLTH